LGKYVCVYCGVEFNSSHKRKYCSLNCFGLAHSKQVLCLCTICGKSFEISNSRSKRNGGKYCSNACRVESMRDRVIRDCEQCKKEFDVIPYAIAHGAGRFCSRKCADDHRKGETHYAWKGGISFEPYCKAFNEQIKEDTRSLFGRKCVLCGSTEEKERLHIHHIDYNKVQGCKGRRWSLIPLCRSCHSKTNTHRHYYFNLLANYWAAEYNLPI